MLNALNETEADTFFLAPTSPFLMAGVMVPKSCDATKPGVSPLMCLSYGMIKKKNSYNYIW